MNARFAAISTAVFAVFLSAATPIELQYGSVEVSRDARASAQAQREPEGKWWHDAVFYQIFPRSFSDFDGDGIGDFRGLLAHLDDLNAGPQGGVPSLGINALWLTPIFDSPSYHGYDTRDYYKVHSDLGSLAHFRDFVEGCRQRGIRVVLDLMLNHTSDEHPWFLESAKNARSPKRNWYVWRDKDPGWTRPWDKGAPVWHQFGKSYYYALFWRGMPDLNFEHEAVFREMVDVAKFWLGLGVSGFRLDAVKHLVEKDGELANRPENHALLRRFVAEVRKDFPEALFVGEVWDGPDKVAPYYGKGDELDLAFGFNTSGGILKAARDRDAAPFVKALQDDLKFLPVQRFNAPFLTNHDMDRVGRILEGKTDSLKLAATALLALPGTPFLYYGEELGVTNSAVPGDEGRRAVMLWNSDCASGAGFSPKGAHWTALPPCGTGKGAVAGVREQKVTPNSLWSHYRHLITTRQAHKALRTGVITGLSEGKGGLVILERAVKGEAVVVAINFGESESEAEKVALNAKTLSTAGFSTEKVPAPAEIYPRASTCFMAAAQKLDCMWDGRSLTLNPIPAGGSVWLRVGEAQQ